MNVEWCSREALLPRAERRIQKVDVVLDIGPGIRPQSLVEPKVHICIEPFAPYIERVRASPPSAASFVFLNATWDAAARLLPDNSVDSVFAIDVIEHLEKEDGHRLLAEAVRIASRQVVIFTPYGFFPQTYTEGDLDRWGMAGAQWQNHLSGWLPEDFGPGWEFVCCSDFHLVDDMNRPIEKPIGAMWAIRTLQSEAVRPAARTRARGMLRRALPASAYLSLRNVLRRLRGVGRQ